MPSFPGKKNRPEGAQTKATCFICTGVCSHAEKRGLRIPRNFSDVCQRCVYADVASACIRSLGRSEWCPRHAPGIRLMRVAGGILFFIFPAFVKFYDFLRLHSLSFFFYSYAPCFGLLTLRYAAVSLLSYFSVCMCVCLCVLSAECSQWSRADFLSGSLEPVSVRHHSAAGLYESRAFKQAHYLFSSGFVTHGAEGISYRCLLLFSLGRVKGSARR